MVPRCSVLNKTLFVVVSMFVVVLACGGFHSSEALDAHDVI